MFRFIKFFGFIALHSMDVWLKIFFILLVAWPVYYSVHEK